jgi:hypothetical protein
MVSWSTWTYGTSMSYYYNVNAPVSSKVNSSWQTIRPNAWCMSTIQESRTWIWTSCSMTSSIIDVR